MITATGNDNRPSAALNITVIGASLIVGLSFAWNAQRPNLGFFIRADSNARITPARAQSTASHY
jgi:hypothetical protein